MHYNLERIGHAEGIRKFSKCLSKELQIFFLYIFSTFHHTVLSTKTFSKTIRISKKRSLKYSPNLKDKNH